MVNHNLLLAAIVGYFGVLYFIAYWMRTRSQNGNALYNNGIMYAFSLAVYCTSWTFYGSVGSAANSGPLFLAIYLGPTLGILVWHSVLKKMVRISRLVRVSSLADFIATRYGDSQVVAATVTVIVLIGILPYIALQHKAVTSTFKVLTGDGSGSGAWIHNHVGEVVAILLVGFTIFSGARTLRISRRNEGLVAAVATESVIKLGSFLIAGVFVTFFLFNGFDDLFGQISSAPELAPIREAHTPVSKWFAYLLLSMVAFFLLPRQFHLAVVENRDENHIKTALWVVPLYLLLINIFVLPFAGGGLLKGLPLAQADSFVLSLPMQFGPSWLALLVFIGGFSAATSMIMVSSLTMATMATNHLLMPLASLVSGFGFIRRRVLMVRWLSITAVNLVGFWYAKTVGNSYTLLNMGMMSFAAALQFAPAIVAGLFWQGASRKGALAGMGGGFGVWLYCLLLPSLSKSGWLGSSWLQDGPFGLSFLRPEHLLGVGQLDPITHAVFWSLAVNLSFLVLGSILWPPHGREVRRGKMFVQALSPKQGLDIHTDIPADILLSDKLTRLKASIVDVLPVGETQSTLEKCLAQAGIPTPVSEGQCVDIIQLTELVSQVESAVAEITGASTASYLVRQKHVYAESESKMLSKVYADIFASMNLNPQELTERINYYQERESLQKQYSEDLEDKIQVRTMELEETLGQLQCAQDGLVQSEKMASIGMLAAGVAHEINNPVGYISSNLNTLAEYADDLRKVLKGETEAESKDDLGLDIDQSLDNKDSLQKVLEDEELQFILDDLPDLISESIEGTNRIREIVGDLRNFSHSEGSDQVEEDIHEIIDRALNVAHNELKYNATVEKQYGQLPRILCYGNRLGQVFLNLFVNASHAIESMGTITVTTGCSEDLIWITVADTGKGISQENLGKIFDPFFTTKDVGKGTGLGLHLSYNIIKAHTGTIEVESEVGKGTTFRIELPLTGASEVETEDSELIVG